MYYPHLSTSVVVPVMTQEVKKKGKKKRKEGGRDFLFVE